MKKIILLALLAACLLFPRARSGEEEKEAITVVATGMGVDSDAALKNALKNAVSQAVGSIIDSETMIKNDEIIEDKILSHSGGFVEKYDIVGEPKAKDGLVTVKIEAEVKRMNLKKEMEVNNIIAVKKIDGQVFTRQIQLDEAAAMFRKKLENFPEAYIDVKLNGDPYFDEKQNKFAIQVTTTLNPDKVTALTKDLIEFLDAALPEPADVLRRDIAKYTSPDRYTFNLRVGKKHLFYLPVFMNKNMTMSTWKAYQLTGDLIKVVNDAIIKRPWVLVDITIDGDVSIVKKWYKLPLPLGFVTNTASERFGSVSIAPYLNEDLGDSTLSLDDFRSSRSLTYTYYFDLDAEEVKLIKDVKLSMGR